ncbi:hypothetical protein L1887_47081 [Cichorium endivia]|nr:hypothetical protein L1887_47081 [Cichorium endivia]
MGVCTTLFSCLLYIFCFRVHLVGKGLQTGDALAEDEGVDDVGALVGVDGLQVLDVATAVVLVRGGVAAKDVEQAPRVLQRLAAVVPLGERDHLGAPGALVLHATELQTAQKAERSFGRGVGELLLDELEAGDGAAELRTVEGVLAGLLNAGLEGAHGAPRDAVARRVEALERRAETGTRVREQRLVALHLDVLHEDGAGDRGTQLELVLDGGRREALGALFDDEAADLVVPLALCPDDKDVCVGRVGDPGLAAVEDDVAVAGVGGGGLHGAGVGAVVGLGETEAADELTLGEARQILLLLRLGSELVDGAHDERALNGHDGAVARVDALDLPGDEAVGDAVDACTAVAVDGCAEQAELAERGEDGGVPRLVAVHLGNLGLERLLAEIVCGLGDGLLVLRELGLEHGHGIFPVELAELGHLVLLGRRIGRGSVGARRRWERR